MSVEGLGAVQARVAEIEARLAHLTTPTAPTRAAGGAPALGAGGLGPAALGGTMTAASFAQAYDGAVARTALTPAAPGAPGGYGRLTPPAELVRYGNGRIPPEALAPLGDGGHRLWAPAADAFARLQADAARDGVTIGLTDSYRSYDEQVELAERKGLYSHGGLAATPGSSNHGWGMAVDVDVDEAGQRWLRENGARYGWVESVPREPWHWEYRPAGRA